MQAPDRISIPNPLSPLSRWFRCPAGIKRRGLFKLSLVASSLLFPILCHANETCLWMNAATAGGILGGAVTTTVSPAKTDLSNIHTANAKSSEGPTSANPLGTSYFKAGMDDSDCAFVLTPAELHIEVRTMNDPKKDFAMFAARCGKKATALKAVGNEASACTPEALPGQTIHQVVGRVRDRAFIIRLTTSQNSLPSVLDDKVRRAADIVAGNLF